MYITNIIYYKYNYIRYILKTTYDMNMTFIINNPYVGYINKTNVNKTMYNTIHNFL